MPRVDPHHRPKPAPARVAIPAEPAAVMTGFHAALRDEAHKAGMTLIEYSLWAAAEKLMRAGRRFDGLFEPRDLDPEDAR